MGDLWLRLWVGITDDPKVQRLPLILFRAWINCLCIAKANGGPLPEMEDIAYKLKVTKGRAEAMISDLRNARLIDLKDGQLWMHDWDEWQFQSDSSTERVKRWRNAKRNVAETPNETLHETLH